MPATAGNMVSRGAGFLSRLRQSPLGQSAMSSGSSFLRSQGMDTFRSIMGSKKAKGLALGGLFLAGIGKEVIRPTIKAGLDVAFDDPNADQKVLGTDLSPSMLLGGSLTGGGANPGVTTAGAVVGGVGGAVAGGAYGYRRGGLTGLAVGATLGGISGGYAGAGIGSIVGGNAPAFIGGQARTMNAYRFGGGATNPYYAARAAGGLGALMGGAVGAGYGLKRGGTKGAILGAIGGGVAGGTVGGAIGAGGSIQYATKYARTNAAILGGSPFYNQSLMTADRMNARGDIVLGAYNTRRGQY